MKTLVFYGAGENVRVYLRIYQKYGFTPACIADRDPGKWGSAVAGVDVVSPEEAKRRHRDFALVITPDFPLKEKIRAQLVESGFVSPDDIVEGIRDWTARTGGPLSPLAEQIEKETPTPPALAGRIAAMYQKQVSGQKTGGMWEDINSKKRDLHEALQKGHLPQLAKMLSNPLSTDLFYGFDNLCKSVNIGEHNIGEEISLLYRLGEIWGGFAVHPPAFFQTLAVPPVDNEWCGPGVEPILETLNRTFSCEIAFPNPYYGESGIGVTAGGRRQIISYRAIQALHQAFTIWEKLGHQPGRVLEIGAGLGRTAYYCKTLFGIDYTIIDLPMTQVAAAHFLAQALGEEAVCLYGEPYRPGQIRILPPPSTEGNFDKMDLAVNFDSLTEMGYAVMAGYWEKIKKSAAAFLSVNHEFHPHTVRELIVADPAVKTYTRHFYELRDGYAEEYVTLRKE